jgi:hypothetical protein
MSNTKASLLAALIPLVGSWLVVQAQFWFGATTSHVPFALLGIYFM